MAQNMASKNWLVGCGVLAIAGIIALLLGGRFVVQQVGGIRQDIVRANQDYSELNREFAFNVPARGELSEEQFTRYLNVRRVVASAVSPVRDNSGVRRLIALSNMPREVSRVHVEALRRESMSVDEYRWITRQLYTAIAAELARSDADSTLIELARDFEGTLRRQNGIRINGNSGGDLFRQGALDFTWLRVPESTRDIIRKHAGELQATVNASLADQVFLNTTFAQ